MNNRRSLPNQQIQIPYYRHESSLPASLAYAPNTWNTNQIKNQVNALNFNKTKGNQKQDKLDKEYIPQFDQEESDTCSSFEGSSRASSYDPLQNLEEYMRMRDQL